MAGSCRLSLRLLVFFLSGVSIKTNWNYRIHDQTALIADSVEKNEQTYNGSMSTGQQSLSAIKSANSGCLVLFWATQL